MSSHIIPLTETNEREFRERMLLLMQILVAAQDSIQQVGSNERARDIHRAIEVVLHKISPIVIPAIDDEMERMMYSGNDAEAELAALAARGERV